MDRKEYCKVTVHWENKSTGKIDTRILIMRSDRMEVAVLKGQIRTERIVHFLDIRRLETSDENRASLHLATGECLQFTCTLEADLTRLVSHLVASLRFHLPQLRTAQQQLMELRLPKAWNLESMVEGHMAELGRPAAASDKCGHFGTAYEFFCRYAGAEVLEEIRWDVETIYFSQGCRTFCLADFSHFGQTDFAVILAALSFNDYFTVLNVNGIKFTQQMTKFLELMLTYNTSLLELHLSNCGLKLDSVKAMASALEANSGCRIRVLDLSGNAFNEDKTVDRLCALLSRLNGSLERLVLGQCGLSAKALNRVCDALGGGQQGLQGPPPLSHLVIDCNEQKGENSTRASIIQMMKPRGLSSDLIQKYVAKATNLEHLSCVGCDFNLDSFAPAFLRGLTQCVTHLDLSGNSFWNLRRGSRPKDTPALSKDWGLLFASCLRLRLIRLNACRLPPQAVSDLLSSLGANRNLKGVRLELAGNELGAIGAQVLCSCLTSCSIDCLEALDVSDNAFDTELNRVVEAVCRSPIRHLAIGGNNFRAKDANGLEEFSELVTDAKSTLESLSIRDSRLRERIVVLLNAVGQCRNLCKLDITGNWMQDLGAKFLAKSLYLNSSLTEVLLDDNQIGLSGLKDIAEALQFNSNLRTLPVPAVDVARLLADSTVSAASVHSVLATLQQGLLKNQSATYQVTGRDYRLQSELGSYAFSLDHLAGRLDHGLKAIDKSDPDPEVGECERRCRAAMRDALSARYLLTGLSGVAESRPAVSVGLCVREQLTQPLLTSATKDLIDTQAAMLEFLQAECPNAFQADPSLNGTLRNRLTTDRSQFSAASVLALLERSAGASVASKLSALQLNSALLINDCMQEVIGHNLQQAEQALSKLMRTKMLQPNLRHSGTQKASDSDAERQPPTSPEPQSPRPGNRANKRPISSIFGKKGNAKAAEVVEISIDEEKLGNSADGDEKLAKQSATPQPLPRRPVGCQSRRLPTSKLLRQQRQSEREKENAAEAEAEAEAEEDEVYEDADIETEPVFEERDADEPKRQPAPGAVRKLPVGAVQLMGMGFGPPPPQLLQQLSKPAEEDAAPPATLLAARIRQNQTGVPPVAISQEDLAKTVRVLRRADTMGGPAGQPQQPQQPQQPPAPAPKPKPKAGAKPPASAESPAKSKVDRTSSTIDSPSSSASDEAGDRILQSLPATSAARP